jgi:hypothetical protein
MEEWRMQHEKEMRELQYEHEKMTQERADKRKLADKVAKWGHQPARGLPSTF